MGLVGYDMGVACAEADVASKEAATETINTAPVAKPTESRRFKFNLYCMMKFQRRVKPNIVSGKDILHRHLRDSHPI
jgi:hypothetical protein